MNAAFLFLILRLLVNTGAPSVKVIQIDTNTDCGNGGAPGMVHVQIAAPSEEYGYLIQHWPLSELPDSNVAVDYADDGCVDLETLRPGADGPDDIGVRVCGTDRVYIGELYFPPVDNDASEPADHSKWCPAGGAPYSDPR